MTATHGYTCARACACPCTCPCKGSPRPVGDLDADAYPTASLICATVGHLSSHLSSLISINLSSQQACRAVGGLLAYLQRTDVGSSMSIGKLERCRHKPC